MSDLCVRSYCPGVLHCCFCGGSEVSGTMLSCLCGSLRFCYVCCRSEVSGLAGLVLFRLHRRSRNEAWSCDVFPSEYEA